MIVFHEGLPGSGKSYEALVSRIVPALAKRRPVDAYVEGLDHAKIATLAGITEDEGKALLIALTRDQAAQVHKLSRDNALVVLDEAQNFWGNRAKMDAELTEYVTEHRHRGQDIILMGQDLRDVHALWRRRVELKLRFMKLTAFGAAKRYSVGTYRCVGPDKFEKVGTQITKYDAKYFGCYKSHVSDDTNTADYKEDRATLLKSPLFRIGMPVALVLALWGANTAWNFFRPAPKEVTAAVAPAARKPGTAPPSVPQAPLASSPAPDQRSAQERRFSKLSSDYRIRLAGLVQRGTRVQGVVEWIDSGMRVIDRLTLDQLRDLGVAVAAGEGYVRLVVGEWNELATMWPLEGLARPSDSTIASLKPPPEPTPSQPIFINASRNKPEREPASPLTIDTPRYAKD